MTNNNDTEVDTDITYTFTLAQQITPEYGMSAQILEWLQNNMNSLQDDLNHPIFGKVNFGFNETVIKTFGKKPVCDIYIDKVEYNSDFDGHIPTKVHSIVIFYLKGANNTSYFKASQLHDLIMQEFITNETFRRLTDIVQDTYITGSQIKNQNIRGGYGVIGAFELTHDLY